MSQPSCITLLESNKAVTFCFFMFFHPHKAVNFGPWIIAPMEHAFNTIQGELKKTDDLLRKLEKSSKFLTQYVYTSVALQKSGRAQKDDDSEHSGRE